MITYNIELDNDSVEIVTHVLKKACLNEDVDYYMLEDYVKVINTIEKQVYNQLGGD